MVTSPSSGVRTVDSIRIVVVFPAPFGPSSPKISCLPMLNDTPSTACSPLKDLRSSLATRNSLESSIEVSLPA